MNALEMLLAALAKDMEQSATAIETLDDPALDRAQYLAMSALVRFKPVFMAAERLSTAASAERNNRIQRGPDQQLEYFRTRTHEHLKADQERRERITCVICGIHEASLDPVLGGNFALTIHFDGSKAELNEGWDTRIPLLCRACAKKMPAPWNRIFAVPGEIAAYTGVGKV